MNTAVLGAALIWAAFVAPGFAETIAPKSDIVVRYGDLNLSKPDEAAMMMSRLRYAAFRVCYDNLAQRAAPAAKREAAACRERAVAFAIDRLNAPELTRLYTPVVGYR